MDSERPIEKLLRDAGRKRASERNVELHPATRRMLQAEVVREFGKPGSESRSASPPDSLSRWWLRLGWSFGVLLGVAAAALLMIPREQPRREMTLAQSKPGMDINGRDRRASPGLAGPTPSSEKLQAAGAEATPRPLVPAPQPTTPSVATLSDTATRKAEPEPARPAELAPTQTTTAFGGQLASRELRAYSESSQTLNSPVAPPAASAPASAATAPAPVVAQNHVLTFAGTAAAFDLDGRTDALTQRFKREVAEDEKKTADKDALRPPPLTSFAFELNGDKVRIVDADGSVYSGSLDPQGTAEGDLLKESVAPKAKSLDSSSANVRLETVPSGAVAQARAPRVQGYGFRVIGTNRSLSAKIDFSGSITGVTNALPSPGNNETVNGSVREAGATTAGAPLQKPGLQQAQISGKAVVGEKQLLDVKATATQR